MLKNYKIKVNNEAESKEAQELFFELGHYRNNGLDVKNLDAKFLYVWNNQIKMGYCSDIFSAINYCEITLTELRDLVVLHRNDVKDGNYQYCDRPVLKLETQDYKVWDSENNAWNEYIGSQTDFRKGIKPIQPKPEQDLISGADAKLAWANGQDVQLRPKTPSETWEDLSGKHSLDIFEQVISYEFRLKPRSIKLSLEIPAPFEPKDGDEVWFIDSDTNRGYSVDDVGEGCESKWIQFGAWRTEEEIKQVVAALRGAICKK